MRTEDGLQLLQQSVRQLEAPERGQQLPGRLLGLPAHVPGAAQEHGRQGPVVLPAAGRQGALATAGRGSPRPASRPSHTAVARAPPREQGRLARGGR